MRKIKYIAVHCTATTQSATVESIERYWSENLGWKSPGYHYIIDGQGYVTALLPDDKVSNGVRGYNSESVNVCYIGGIDGDGKGIDNRTEAQKYSLLQLLRELKTKYSDAIIQGHRDFPNVAKACPCFDAKGEYADILSEPLVPEKSAEELAYEYLGVKCGSYLPIEMQKLFDAFVAGCNAGRDL